MHTVSANSLQAGLAFHAACPIPGSLVSRRGNLAPLSTTSPTAERCAATTVACDASSFSWSGRNFGIGSASSFSRYFSRLAYRVKREAGPLGGKFRTSPEVLAAERVDRISEIGAARPVVIGTVTQCIAHHFRAQDHYRPLQLLLDHRYDLSQLPQPAFETCLVDPKIAASELGPRIHRQCAAAFGLLDIADHDRVRNPNSALRCTYRSVSPASLVWTRAILGSDAITLAIAARNPFASTANNGGTKSLLASHKCGGHTSASLGVVRRSRVSNATGPRSGGPKKLQTHSGPTIKITLAAMTATTAATAKIVSITFTSSTPSSSVSRR